METLYFIGVGYFLPMIIVLMYALWDKHTKVNGIYFPDMWATFSLTPLLNILIAGILVAMTPFVVLVSTVAWLLAEEK